jgi:hypothetical protein
MHQTIAFELLVTVAVVSVITRREVKVLLHLVAHLLGARTVPLMTFTSRSVRLICHMGEGVRKMRRVLNADPRRGVGGLPTALFAMFIGGPVPSISTVLLALALFLSSLMSGP